MMGLKSFKSEKVFLKISTIIGFSVSLAVVMLLTFGLVGLPKSPFSIIAAAKKKSVSQVSFLVPTDLLSENIAVDPCSEQSLGSIYDSAANFNVAKSGLNVFKARLAKEYSAGSKSFSNLASKVLLNPLASKDQSQTCLLPLKISVDESIREDLPSAGLVEVSLGKQSILCSKDKAVFIDNSNLYPVQNSLLNYSKYIKDKNVVVAIKKQMANLQLKKAKLGASRKDEKARLDQDIRKLTLSSAYAKYFAKDGILLGAFFDALCRQTDVVATPVINPKPPTRVPPTSVPPTVLPPTSVPPTSVPPTAVPPTKIPTITPTSGGIVTGFKEGDRVTLTNSTTTLINIRSRAEIAADSFIGQLPKTTIGTIKKLSNQPAHPVQTNDQYGVITWWYVDFDNSEVDGWCGENNYQLYGVTSTPTPVVTATPTPSGPTPTIDPTGLVSSTSWLNHEISNQTGSFRISFSAVPQDDKINTLTGFSNGAAVGYEALGPIVRFAPSGIIDVRNGGGYQADSALNYASGTSYLVTIDIHLGTRTYSVSVQNGSVTTVIASNYAFRTEQAAATQLNRLVLYADTGSHRISNISGPAPIEPPPPGACGSVPHLGTETKSGFVTNSVSEGQTCVAKQISRTCNNGTFSAWSGAESCFVNNAGGPPLTNITAEDLAPPSTIKLNLETRGDTKVYRNSSVNSGQEIVFGNLTMNSKGSGFFTAGFDLFNPQTQMSNYLISNVTMDGYGGRGYGVCLKAGDCPKQDQDLFEIALARDNVVRNLLLRNVVIKNAFVVSSGNHTDIFQLKNYLPSPATQNIGGWFVVQDSLLKNSDHNTMQWDGDYFKGIVYQNMIVMPGRLDAGFSQDCQKRLVYNKDPHCFGNQTISAHSSFKNRTEPTETWLVNSAIGSGNRVWVGSNNGSQLGKVILVGERSKHLLVQTEILASNGSWSRPIRTDDKVFRYDFVEDAIAAHGRPPFLELSCSGWRNPKAGCSTGIGPKHN